MGFKEFKIYQMEVLHHAHALQLFCKHAFKMDSPPHDYVDISRDIIGKADGLPLALVVIGSSLYRKSKQLWKDTLKKLNLVPNQDVHHKLKISFEMLEDAQREIFLDIACYFIGEKRIHPHYMWKALDYFPRSEILVLTRMSLIKVDDFDRLLMHDLLRDLGREIVRQEDLQMPGKRRRLWCPKIALDVVQSRMGTENIIALKLIGLSKEQDFTSEEFSRLPSLRFLELEGGNLVGDFTNLLSSLRWLSWHRCPSDLHTVNLCLWNLVVLKISDSNIPKNWNGWDSCLANRDLKVIHLTRCHLSTVPDFSTCLNLKILVFDEHSPKSLQIGNSICKLERLKRLEIIAPPVQLSKLSESLDFDLFAVPSAIYGLKYLSSLKLEGQCIQELHPSIGEMVSLTCLSLRDCHQLRKLPDSIGKLRSLLELDLAQTEIIGLPDSIGYLKNLEKMSLDFTPIRELPNSIGGLQSLLVLDLLGTKITELPASIGYLKRLERLLLDQSEIRELPKAIGMLENLKMLFSQDCRNLEGEIPMEEWNLSKDITWPPELWTLSISCDDPRSLTRLPFTLRLLELSDVKLPLEEPFFSNLRYLRNLSALSLFRCRLKEVEFEQLETLHHLIVVECELLVRLSGLSSIGKLEELTVNSCSQLLEIRDLGELESLKTLSIQDCGSIERLPNLSKLHELRTLHLLHCESLQGLPDVPNTCHPYVHGCPTLCGSGDKLRDCRKCCKLRGYITAIFPTWFYGVPRLARPST
ncbi:disease resistance protein L6-like [Syzygium oleosum]|uniref:disease resistance protein L6-like n=1 Tax=Syzygium oleosum TaxID=219896 RepID=UPI0024BA01AA|nr:disease resistance protein L6-like [Syzygium oleosum]